MNELDQKIIQASMPLTIAATDPSDENAKNALETMEQLRKDLGNG